jgi:glycosyltransferase involved in cell wall biosynthesis
MEPIDIVINNFRRLHYLGALINAIEERTKFSYRIIVVDNCSTLETKQYIEYFKEDGRIWKSIYNEKNLLLGQSFKKGVELVESEYCVITVDDCLPPYSEPCWLTQLNYLIRNTDFGAIALRPYRCKSMAEYFKTPVKKIDLTLDKNNVLEKRAVEEYFQIQKTEDILKVGFGNPLRERRQSRLREFATKMKTEVGKKMGVGVAIGDPMFKAVAWLEENLGYENNTPERSKFDIIN